MKAKDDNHNNKFSLDSIVIDRYFKGIGVIVKKIRNSKQYFIYTKVILRRNKKETYKAAVSASSALSDPDTWSQKFAI